MGKAALLVLAACGRIGFDNTDVGDVPRADVLSLDYEGFAMCPSELVLDGVARCTGGQLELTPNATDQVGSVWASQSIAIGATTRIAIAVQLTYGGAGGDGAVVVVQGDPRGSTAIGDTGGNLAYGGIMPSVGFEADDYMNPRDPNNNHVGFDVDGDTGSVVTADPTFTMAYKTFWVWLDYDGLTSTLAGYVAQSATKPSAPILSLRDDLARLGPQVFLGITGSTGNGTQLEHVLVLRLAVTQ